MPRSVQKVRKTRRRQLFLPNNVFYSLMNIFMGRWQGAGSISLIVALFMGCTTEPVTGRKQFSLVSSSEETQLGLASFDKMENETPINHGPAVNALVQKVGKRIAAVAELPNAQWEFVVFESHEVNAFCLPGGKVGVYTGLLPITQTEDGLATVIGHEVAHAVAHHGGERMSDAMALQVGGQALGIGLSSADPRLAQAANLAYGVTSQVGVMLPFSRRQEKSADEIGLMYMARAGYDPAAAVSFWQRFAEYNKQHGGSGGLAFMRTHPVDEARIKDLQTWLPKAQQEYHPKAQ